LFDAFSVGRDFRLRPTVLPQTILFVACGDWLREMNFFCFSKRTETFAGEHEPTKFVLRSSTARKIARFLCSNLLWRGKMHQMVQKSMNFVLLTTNFVLLPLLSESSLSKNNGEFEC